LYLIKHTLTLTEIQLGVEPPNFFPDPVKAKKDEYASDTPLLHAMVATVAMAAPVL
jgi:hypothetical protein